MPKVPMYTLTWSSARETYELYQTRDQGRLSFIPGSPEWFAWLEQVSSFAFVGKSNHYTARKEAKQRGGRYWYAYLTTGEHLTKKYLGKTADLSLGARRPARWQGRQPGKSGRGNGPLGAGCAGAYAGVVIASLSQISLIKSVDLALYNYTKMRGEECHTFLLRIVARRDDIFP